jgi:transposase-like protein
MSWNEIKRRAKDGCPLTVLAELNGVDCITMRKAIAQLEKETEEKIVWGSMKKKKPVTKKRKKIDKDQVKAWLIAGKSVNEIAQDLGCSTAAIFKIKRELKKEMSGKLEVTGKEETPDGILIEAETVPEENKYPFVEIVQEYKEINPEVADQLDRFLDEKIEALEKELNERAVIFDKLKGQLDSWIEIKKRVEGTK